MQTNSPASCRSPPDSASRKPRSSALCTPSRPAARGVGPYLAREGRRLAGAVAREGSDSDKRKEDNTSDDLHPAAGIVRRPAQQIQQGEARGRAGAHQSKDRRVVLGSGQADGPASARAPAQATPRDTLRAASASSRIQQTGCGLPAHHPARARPRPPRASAELSCARRRRGTRVVSDGHGGSAARRRSPPGAAQRRECSAVPSRTRQRLWQALPRVPRPAGRASPVCGDGAGPAALCRHDARAPAHGRSDAAGFCRRDTSARGLLGCGRAPVLAGTDEVVALAARPHHPGCALWALFRAAGVEGIPLPGFRKHQSRKPEADFWYRFLWGTSTEYGVLTGYFWKILPALRI